MVRVISIVVVILRYMYVYAPVTAYIIMHTCFISIWSNVSRNVCTHTWRVCVCTNVCVLCVHECVYDDECICVCACECVCVCMCVSVCVIIIVGFWLVLVTVYIYIHIKYISGMMIPIFEIYVCSFVFTMYTRVRDMCIYVSMLFVYISTCMCVCLCKCMCVFMSLCACALCACMRIR